MSHKPVLLQEVLSYLAESQKTTGFFWDGTFGRGGHARHILESFPNLTLIASDKDPEAIQYGQQHLQHWVQEKRIFFIHDDFEDLETKKKILQTLKNASSERGLAPSLSGALLDLGVSSPQLDIAQRGFSFYNDGPLDMRMDPSQGKTAQDILQTSSADELTQIFQTLGEIQRPQKVVNTLIKQRAKHPLTSTGELAQLIIKTTGWRKKNHHPATRYFLALRMTVNQELEAIQSVLKYLPDIMQEGSYLQVISFHSLEDRIVKKTFKGLQQDEKGVRVNKKVQTASYTERKANPRSRSAKLRVFKFSLTKQTLS